MGRLVVEKHLEVAQPTKNMTSQKASMIRNRVQIGHNFDCLEPAPQLFHLYACYCYKL